MARIENDAVNIAYSDEWWFYRLFQTFYARKKCRDGVHRSRVQWADYLWRWYEGNPELPQHQQGWQSQVTRDVLRMGRANLAYLAVESKLDRIQLLSFRTTTESDDPPPEGGDEPDGPEKTARKLMRKYGTVFDDALLYASVMNDGYIWLGEPGPRDGLPTVTAEDPRACVTIDDPLDPTRVIAAIKMYRNDVEKRDYAHVVLPAKPKRLAPPDEAGNQMVLEEGVGHRIRVASRPSRSNGMSSSWSAGGWEWIDDQSGEYPDEVQDRGALVHHVTAPNGLGDIEPVIDLLERINNMIVDRLWISKFQAFRQRAMQEKADPQSEDRPDPMPKEDEDGNPIDWDEILSSDPGAVWRLPIGMTIWESTPTDLTGALLAVRDDIKEFAAVTRTPIYVFTPDAVNGSATGASLAREGQVFKAEKWVKRHTAVFLAVCADMLAIAGHGDAADDELELKWGPAERVTMGERTNSAVQAKAAGVPEEGVWEDFLQATPETMKRYRALAAKDRARQLLFQVPAAPGNPARPEDQVTPPAPPAPTPPVPDAVDALATI